MCFEPTPIFGDECALRQGSACRRDAAPASPRSTTGRARLGRGVRGARRSLIHLDTASRPANPNLQPIGSRSDILDSTSRSEEPRRRFSNNLLGFESSTKRERFLLSARVNPQVSMLRNYKGRVADDS